MQLDPQVNIQELHRLNDAIAITLDAIRRVVPQLSMLQQQPQQPFYPPFGQQQPLGYQQSMPWQSAFPQQLGGVGFGGWGGQQPQVDPVTAAAIQAQALRQVLGQMGVGGVGQQAGFQQPFGGQYGQSQFGMPYPGMPFQIPQQRLF